MARSAARLPPSAAIFRNVTPPAGWKWTAAWTVTARQVVEAGADVLVAGSAIYGARTPPSHQALRE